MTRKSNLKVTQVRRGDQFAHPPSVLTQSNQGWLHGVLLPSLLSAIVLWAASPPLAWGILAWLAPLGWLWICGREQPVGRSGYWALWLSGCLFWLLILHGIRLAYWPLLFGWLSLSLYLAVYIPVFVAATRVMVWRWGCPLVLAAPTVWLGLELMRSYLLTGYAANSLAHTQVNYPVVIQFADQLGSGGISFLVMTVATALFSLIQKGLPSALRSSSKGESVARAGSPRNLFGLIWAVSLLAVALGYGWWRLAGVERMQADNKPLLRALLLQENTPSIFDNYSPERNQQSWEAYLQLTRKAAAEYLPGGPIDLVVWPESTFTANEPWVEVDVSQGLPAELLREQVDEGRLVAWSSDMVRALSLKTQLVLAAVRQSAASQTALNDDPNFELAPTWPHLLVGSDVMIYTSSKVERFNSALWIGPDGQLQDRYAKMHLVMFGEYIPLGPLLQWLRDLVGLAGMDAGSEVKSFAVGQVRVAPSICFESMMPRVINGQVRRLAAKGESPHVLINITNDSWFRGSTMLDHHLACSILCAVENRRPLLVAANTGLTASIDSSGRVLQLTERLKAQAILAEPKADGRWGMVQWLGYPFSWLCAAVTLAALVDCFRKPKIGSSKP
jgi:apolipoprotein N-acyltransferase